MGKRSKSRLTAKTGDKSVYKNRSAVKNSALEKNKSKSNDDDMFDEVDAYHNTIETKLDSDFLKLDGGDSSSSDEDGIVHGREQVLDLGIADSSDEDDFQEEEWNDDTEEQDDHTDASELDTSTDDDTASNEMDNEQDNNALDSILDWGGKKRGYYGGDNDNADLDAHVEDALLEEQAAKQVQQARYAAMSEDDFLENFGHKTSAHTELDEDDDDPQKNNCFVSPNSMIFFDEDSPTTTEKIIQSNNTATLSFTQKMRLISKQSPEMIPLMQHFKTNAVEQYRDNILIVAEQLLAKPNQSISVGTTSQGMQYLRHKQMLHVSTMINVCMYLLLKMDEDMTLNIKDHPVIVRLNQLQELADRLRDNVEEPFQLLQQLETLSKAATLMANGEISSEEDDGSSEVDQDETGDSIVEEQEDDNDTSEEEGSVGIQSNHDLDDGDTENAARNAIIEARFGVRAQDMDSAAPRPVYRPAPDAGDFGDEEVDEQDVRRVRIKLSSAVNTITQKEKSKSKKIGQNQKSSGDMDNDMEERREYQKLQTGLDLMESMIGKDSDEEKGRVEDVDDYEMGDDEDGFYETIRQKTKLKKELKKSTYEVLPKYPGMEQELEGERAVSRMIMKNRGLVPHKPKINRNPRVKKREQYRKAVIRRKGAVRDVRTEEADRYGGELTGIKSNLSKSRKLGVK